MITRRQVEVEILPCHSVDPSLSSSASKAFLIFSSSVSKAFLSFSSSVSKAFLACFSSSFIDSNSLQRLSFGKSWRVYHIYISVCISWKNIITNHILTIIYPMLLKATCQVKLSYYPSNSNVQCKRKEVTLQTILINF